MTSLSRKKRPITAPGLSMPARMLVSLALVLAFGLVSAQETPRPLPLNLTPWQPAIPDLGQVRHASQPPIKTLNFHKLAAPEPNGAPPVLPISQERVLVTTTEALEPQIQLSPPSFERLIRLESELALRERIRQENRDKLKMERVEFPEDKSITEERFQARSFPTQVALIEPNYVCYGRLFFRDLNAEHYGWDFGLAQPFLSAGIFFKDVALLPYHWGKEPFRCFDSSAGLCLPGDPVPYLLDPPGFSVSGGASQAGAILGLMAIFP